MNFYYFNTISAITYRSLLPGRKNNKWFLFLVCLQMFIILSIRADSFGADAPNYIRFYNLANTLSLSDILRNWSFFQVFPMPFRIECGYILMNWIFAKLGLSYHAYIMILAFIDCYVMYRFLREFSSAPLMGTMIFQMSTLSYVYVLRRSMAMNFIFLALIQLKKNKYFKSMVLLIIAVTMHRIALAFIFYPLLSRIKITRKFFRISCFVIILAAMFASKGVDLVFMIFNALGKGGYVRFTLDIGTTTYARIFLAAIAFFGIYNFVDFEQFQKPENAALCGVFLLYFLFLPILVIARSALINLEALLIIPMFIMITNIIVKYPTRNTRLTLRVLVFLLITWRVYHWISLLPSTDWGKLVSKFITVWD